MNKAVFLDKDGTLIKDVPYNVALEKMVLEDGVAEGLKHLKEMGYFLIVISNQPGIAKGLFKEDQLLMVFHHLHFLRQTAAVTMIELMTEAILPCVTQPVP